MHWWTYVRTAAGPDQTPADIARATSVSRSTVSRWEQAGVTPSADAVIAFARAYHRPVTEALAAAEYIDPDEAGTTAPPLQPVGLADVPHADLLRELQRRLIGSNVPASIRSELPSHTK